ncbi:MAG: Gfo/Idh/MocA family oxidoreductase, partial [Conexibacteraceae bacterium]|nr:Gfo/Idh/MocA family oxidoreductase [Conexibacteraceae bacterium]
MSRPTIGVGMLGYGFMGRAHTHALRTLAYMTWPPPADVELVAICGRTESAVKEAAERYGYTRAVTDWRELVADPSIQLLHNVGPNALHAEPTIAAAKAGKHVICEKPLARSADESLEVWRAVEATGVKHLCAFNYRFVPAVRLARQLIESGELGEIHHFRGRYLQAWLLDPAAPPTWRVDRDQAGSGALGDLGAHVIDQARYLVGEISAVSGRLRTFVPERAGTPVTVDDAFEGVLEF